MRNLYQDCRRGLKVDQSDSPKQMFLLGHPSSFYQLGTSFRARSGSDFSILTWGNMRLRHLGKIPFQLAHDHHLDTDRRSADLLIGKKNLVHYVFLQETLSLSRFITHTYAPCHLVYTSPRLGIPGSWSGATQ